MATTVRAWAITPGVTYVDGRTTATPDGWAEQGMGRLLLTLAARAAEECTVLLDRHAAAALGMPARKADMSEVMDAHPCAEDARAHGWKVRDIGPWSTFTGADRPTIRVGVMSMLDPVAMGLAAPTLDVTTANLAEWYDRTGSAFHGTPGAAGSSILGNLYPGGARRKGSIHPAWKPTRKSITGETVAAGPVGAVEDDYHIEHWQARSAGTSWAHGYDAERAYVAACTTVKVCPYALRPTGRRQEWTPDRAGWWEVDLPAWNIPHMPDPAGYHPDGRAIRWVSGPTMELLTQLQEEGIYGNWRILDSWTGPAKEVLKPWAGKLRDAWDLCQREQCRHIKTTGLSQVDLCQVCLAVKDAGRHTIGLFNRPTHWIYRPDWHYSIIAQFRANLWRKAWRVGGGQSGRGPWPLWIDVDNIWYGSELGNPRVACPEGIKIGPGLGQFKPKRSKRNRNQGKR